VASWEAFSADAGDLAGRVEGRFRASGLAFLATLRADGSPRASAIEVFFGGGELWLGMMHGSRKAADLVRDRRLALHSATTDKQVSAGDAKLAGHAVDVGDDADAVAAFVAAVQGENGRPPPEPFHAFKVDVTEVSLLTVGPGGDHLVIEVWKPGQAVRRIERR
jgi:hypothetical protein